MARTEINNDTEKPEITPIEETNLKATKIVIHSGVAPYDAPLKFLIPVQAAFEVSRITMTIGRETMIILLTKEGHIQINFIKASISTR